MDSAPSPTGTDPSADPQVVDDQSTETHDQVGQPEVLESPVFVDGSGRRRRWLVRGAYGLAALGVLYVGGLGYSLAAGTVSPDTRLPLAEVIAPVAEALLPAAAPRDEEDSTTVVRRPSGVPTGSQGSQAPALAPNRATTSSTAPTAGAAAAAADPSPSASPGGPAATAPAASPAPTAVASATAPAPSPTGTTAPTGPPPAEPSPEPTAPEPTAPEPTASEPTAADPSLPIDVPTVPGLP